MSNSVFVSREAELHKLKTFLDNATLGKAQSEALPMVFTMARSQR